MSPVSPVEELVETDSAALRSENADREPLPQSIARRKSRFFQAHASVTVAPDEQAPEEPRTAAPIGTEGISSGRPKMTVLQRWSGTVTEIAGDRFRAVINDLDLLNNPAEEIVLSVEEVPEPDRGLLKVGAMFYWHLGKEQDRYGSHRRYMELRVRRVPSLGAPSRHPPFSSLFTDDTTARSR